MLFTYMIHFQKRLNMNNKYLLINETTENDITNYLPNQNTLCDIADFFDVFSDTTRLKILSCLSMSDLCVNDLSKLLDTNQTTISHQLKNLKAQNLIKANRNGKIITYSLCNRFINDIMMYAVESIKK